MNLFVLLWSQRDNALHVEQLERMLSLNRESYADDEPVNFAPIAIGTEADMLATEQSLRGFWSDDSQIDDMRVWRSERMEGIVIVCVEVLPVVQLEIAA